MCVRIMKQNCGSQGTQTRGTWGVCITERCSSIKNQTIQIGPVKVITDPLFLEGVRYAKITAIHIFHVYKRHLI